MKMKIIIYLILISILIVSCLKDDRNNGEKLPKLTKEGLGTFGCIVDGEIWLPRQLRYPLAGSPPKLEMFYSNDIGLLILRARREYYGNIRREVIKIEIDSVFDIGIYDIKDFEDNLNYPPSSSFQRVFTDNSKMFYQKNELFINTINVVYFDTISQIVSGTFEMKLYDSLDNKILIQNGRFDLKYE